MEKELGREEVKSDNKKPVTLEGDAAILLWLEGKGAWNAWMEDNPKANVDFSGVDFSYKALKKRFPVNENLQKLIANNKDKEISFEGYKFMGHVSFNDAIFSGDANFSYAYFNGFVTFRSTIFNGIADFKCVGFCDGAYFNRAEFKSFAYFERVLFKVDSSFRKAKFYASSVFKNTTFKERADFMGVDFFKSSDFICASFSSEVSFDNATFANQVSFRAVSFNFNASFNLVVFRGDAYFEKSSFCHYSGFIDAEFHSDAFFGLASFNETYFNYSKFVGKADFFDSTFNEKVTFQNAAFESTLVFQPKEAREITSLDFKGAAFEKLFLISGSYNCIPDLRQTKTSHHVDLSKVEVKLNRDSRNGLLLEKSHDEEDVERLCRLKEIAESNKNHRRALAFNADELRASRWAVLNSLQSILDCIYSVTSNYGQSILRPTFFLVAFTFAYAGYLSNEVEKDDGDAGFHVALEYAAGNALPLLSKGLAKDNKAILFEYETPSSFVAASYAHSGLSFGFLFLIGLGLRNRFRI